MSATDGSHESRELNEEELPIVARLCGVNESNPRDAMHGLMNMYSLVCSQPGAVAARRH